MVLFLKKSYSTQKHIENIFPGPVHYCTYNSVKVFLVNSPLGADSKSRDEFLRLNGKGSFLATYLVYKMFCGNTAVIDRNSLYRSINITSC